MGPQHHDAIGENDRLLDVVRHHDQCRLKIGPEIEEVILQVGAGEGIERGEWFVEKKNLRAWHQCAGDGDALRLAAGEFARPHPRLVGQADPVERTRHAHASFQLRVPLQAEADIVGHVQPREQPRLLENDADLLVRRGDDGAVEHHPPLGRRVEPGDRPQHCRLAAAGAADGDEDFPGRDRERNAVERAHPVGISLADAIENEHRESFTRARSGLPSAGTARRPAR